MLTELPIKPGIIKDNSALLSEGRWIDGDKIRFRNVGGRSHPEVIGGYEDLTDQTFRGKARGIHAWERLDGSKPIVVGTSEAVYVFAEAYLWDITPVRAASTLSDPADTTDTDATVTINHTAHGLNDGAYAFIHNGTAVGGLSLGGGGTLSSGSIRTSAGSKALVISETAHGMSTHDRVTFASATAVGGVASANINTTHTIVVLDVDTFLITQATAATSDATGGGTPTWIGLKAYEITYVDANSYTIEAASAATSTVSGGGGTVTYEYAINPGRENTTAQAGYSTGTYSGGLYSLPSGETDLRARIWVMNNFGEDLVANYRNSVLYRWQGVPSQKMAAIAATDAPQENLAHMVTPERFLVAMGTEDATTSTFDPMRVAWAKIEGAFSTNDWTPDSTNSAGGFRLAEGSRIINGVPMPFVSLVWTDTALYQIQYISNIDVVYQPTLLGTSCGLIGPNAMARAGESGQVFWLSSSREFMMWQGGTPVTIQCPVRDDFFDNLAGLQEDLIYAGVNEKHNEILWFYPDETNENARYVTFNYAELHWAVGTFPITAWQERGVYEFPVAAHSDGTIKVHEKGNSDNGSGLSAFVEFAPMDVAEGETLVTVRRFVPDVAGLSGGIKVTLKSRFWPQGAETETEIGTIDSTTTKLDFRVTARQIGGKFEWVSTPTEGRLGRIMFDVLPSGAKR